MGNSTKYSAFGVALRPLAHKNGLTWLDLCEELDVSFGKLLPKLKGHELVGEHFVDQVAAAFERIGTELSSKQINTLKQAANEADAAKAA